MHHCSPWNKACVCWKRRSKWRREELGAAVKMQNCWNSRHCLNGQGCCKSCYLNAERRMLNCWQYRLIGTLANVFAMWIGSLYILLKISSDLTLRLWDYIQKNDLCVNWSSDVMSTISKRLRKKRKTLETLKTFLEQVQGRLRRWWRGLKHLCHKDRGNWGCSAGRSEGSTETLHRPASTWRGPAGKVGRSSLTGM